MLESSSKLFFFFLSFYNENDHDVEFILGRYHKEMLTKMEKQKYSVGYGEMLVNSP